MLKTYHVHSRAAIVGGIAAAAGATALLLRDAFTTGFTVEHALMPLLVGLTTLTGHLALQAIREWRMFAAAGLAFVAAMGSTLTIYETMGRRAEVRDTKTATAAAHAQERADKERMLRENTEAVAKLRRKLVAECGTGLGRRCQGYEYSIKTYEAAIRAYEAELARSPVVPVDAKADRVAGVASLAGYNPDRVKQLVALFEPFALPLFLEFGSIILLSVGLAPASPAPLPAPVPHKAQPVRRSGPYTKAEAEQDIISLLATDGYIPEQSVLVERWHVSKGCVSKWLTEWEDDGLIVRKRDGRRNMLQLV